MSQQERSTHWSAQTVRARTTTIKILMNALAFARVGDLREVHSLSRRLQREYAEDTLVQSVWLPPIQPRTPALNMLVAIALARALELKDVLTEIRLCIDSADPQLVLLNSILYIVN